MQSPIAVRPPAAALLSYLRCLHTAGSWRMPISIPSVRASRGVQHPSDHRGFEAASGYSRQIFVSVPSCWP